MNLKTWWQHCWLPACLYLLVAITQTVSSETRVVCYYTNWSVYRPGTAKFSPQNINPYLCTHLIYAFGGFTKENSLKPFDKYQDIEKGGYAKFTGLKTYNKNLKTMLAIGGWNEGSSRFSPMVASADRRKELVKNTIKFLRQNHFDGLDLDWEYPSFRDGGKPRDRENYAQLVQELREEFDRESEKTGRPRLLLTMAVPAGIEYINKGYDIAKLNKYLDWMNILSYDYHSAFEPAVNHHSPLFPLEEDNEYNFDGDLNIDHTIKHYIKMGADSTKLVLGIPTYGRSYTLFNPDANELGAPADGPGDMGDATRENGYLAFYEICENLKENDWKVVQPNPDAMGPYAYKGNQWVSYDDELIVKKKSIYVAENNLGGIMFWSIDNDDFRGNCYNKPYPLIEAAKEALIIAASKKPEDNFVKPRKPTTRPRRPNSSISKEDSQPVRVQNSGGPQSFEDSSSSSGRKRIRPNSIRTKSRSEDSVIEKRRTRPRGTGRRRKTTTTTQSTTVTSTTPSTLPTTPMYKTPEPPTTPDPGGAEFKCEEDGFFPHPKDCKKYFWCLSGPADLGIIAHQFTCPAGLYFNKAADSCDYTQNVLCNKKLKTTSTTTTTPSTTSSTTTTTAAPSTTRRVPARITAATSRTTFLYTTTTTTEEPEYYDEYEYDDDEEIEDDAPRRGEPDSEEDPQVIKELIDLIKKVGGVEELEKFLRLQENGSMAVTNTGSTTPASISRSLYERVLQSRANAAGKGSSNTNSSKSNSPLVYSTINRGRPAKQEEEKESGATRGNSRFTGQSTGIERPETKEDNRRGRPQYTTITRQRASTEKTPEAENESEDDEIIDDEEEEIFSTKTRQFLTRKQNIPEYVTIRRTRPTSATEPEIEDEDTSTRSSIVRSRQRGIPGETGEDVTDFTQRPEYVTIRRNRPVIEEVTTSKYTTIQRKRPTTESSDDIETTTDIDSSKRRFTTQSSDEDSLEKDKRFRSTTLSSDESSTLSTLNTDTTLEDNKRTTTDKEPTVTETVSVKSTLEDFTDSTAEKTATSTPITELPSTVRTIETEIPSTNQISDSQKEENDTNEKNSSSPQLFRPRPFATRTRSTTTRPTESTEAPTKKVSEPSGTKPGSSRPIIRKFQPGTSSNRFVAKTQNTQSQVDSDRVSATTEENSVGTQEIDTKRDEEYRRRVANRGRSRFTLPTSTAEPTRRRVVSQRTDYEYDYEDVQRTYRPSVLADLSSLTSADIAFQRDKNRKHIRRRPVTSTPSTTTSTTEGPTEPGLRTGSRTLPLARKLISESNFGRNSRRIVQTQNQKPDISTTESNTFESSTKSTLFAKARPNFAALVRTTTQGTSTTTTAPSTASTEIVKTTTQQSDSNEATENAHTEDSSESNSDREYKILKPENDSTNEVTEIPDSTVSPTSELLESYTSEEPTTVSLRIRSTTVPTSSEPLDVPKVNRTRKVFVANRRIRTTTPVSTEIELSNTETIRTTIDFKRQRPSFLNRNQTNRNATRLRSSDDLETNTTSESNRGLVKRIRPIGLNTKINEEEKIKLSETNISEHDYTGPIQNLPEDDSGKYRRRKIVRRIRPSKDTVFSKLDEEEDSTIKRIKITDKRILTKDEIEDQELTTRIRGRKGFLDITTVKDEIETETNRPKRIRLNKGNLFSKSESVDILRAKRIRTSKTEYETENNTEQDDQSKTIRIRQGKTSFLDDDVADLQTDNIATTFASDTDNYNSEISETTPVEDVTRRRPISSLYRPSNDFRNRRLRPSVKQETEESEEESTRPNTLNRKFRPVSEPTNAVRVRLNSTNLENNRKRKIIRRLRPLSTTTTESEFPPSTLTELPSISTTENNISPTTEQITPTENEVETTEPNIETSESTIETTEPNIETTEFSLTTLDDTETTIFTTESTTTTTTSPRPTRPSLIGRSRPAYRPRNRPQVEIRSTTPLTIQPSSFRRRFNGLNRNESGEKEVEREEKKDEVEDGIIDSKLKKLYSKKQKFSPNVRSTTERQILEQEEKTTEEEKTVATIETEKLSTEKEVETTIQDSTEAIEIVTTDSSTDLTTIPDEAEISTIFSTESPTKIPEIKLDIITTTTQTQSTTEIETKSTTVLRTTEATTVDSSSESVTENTEIITTEYNTELPDIPTTEFILTTIPEQISQSISITTEPTLEFSTSESSTSTESTTNTPSTTENAEKQESEKSYKPIRYKPSDRPKLRINLNRTESDTDKNDNDEPKTRKFTPSRTADQRNRSKLAYRKDSTTEKPKDVSERSFVPKGRKFERPGIQLNLNEDRDEKQVDLEEDEEEKEIPEIKEITSERTHYPTLKPVNERFNLFRNRNQEQEEQEEDQEEEIVDEDEDQVPEPERPVENPLIKYLQTIRSNQEVIRTTLDQPTEIVEDPEENIPEEQPEEEIPEENIPEEQEEDIPEEQIEGEDVEYEDEKENLPVENKDQSTKFNFPLDNHPSINRPPIRNQPNVPNVPSRVPNRPQYAPNRPVAPNEPRRSNISSGNRPFNPNENRQPINRPVGVANINRPSLDNSRSGVNRPNSSRNYPRRFNKPVNPTSSSTTTESLAGINLEAVNARNKNLYNKNRKANIPHPVSSTTSTVETTTPTIEISQVTEETILPEPTTEQLSTLHHVFAEPDIPSTTPLSTTVESTTKYNFTAAQIQAAKSLERLIEINRIVEVSLKEDKVKNSSGVVETRVMLEKVPTFDRVGAINRVTVIKVVNGENETESIETSENFPSNHAVTLNEIVTGKRIDTSQKIDIVAQLHAPDIDVTKMNILNNTLEIIEIQRKENSTEEPVVITEISEGEKIPEGVQVHVVNGPKILDQIINDTVLVVPNPEEKKFEINSKSNVVDYSHRELNPIEVIQSAQPAIVEDTKQGRKLAIDSKSVVVNNHNVRPVFTEATTLPLEALFQTNSPDNTKETSVTQLPSLKDVVTGKGNFVDDDQDLLESRNHNGRVRIRILGQDTDYTQSKKTGNPVFAPIRLLNDEDRTLKAEVVEVTSKPNKETIKIAPIELSQTVKVPVVRIESSQSSSVNNLKRETPYFNQEVIFGGRST